MSLGLEAKQSVIDAKVRQLTELTGLSAPPILAQTQQDSFLKDHNAYQGSISTHDNVWYIDFETECDDQTGEDIVAHEVTHAFIQHHNDEIRLLKRNMLYFFEQLDSLSLSFSEININAYAQLLILRFVYLSIEEMWCHYLGYYLGNQNVSYPSALSDLYVAESISVMACMSWQLERKGLLHSQKLSATFEEMQQRARNVGHHKAIQLVSSKQSLNISASLTRSPLAQISSMHDMKVLSSLLTALQDKVGY